jgi:hypothetical protein
MIRSHQLYRGGCEDSFSFKLSTVTEHLCEVVVVLGGRN